MNLLQSLRERAEALDAWRLEVASFGLNRATSASPAPRLEAQSNDVARLGVIEKPKRGRDIKTEDYDPPIKRICILVSAMEKLLEERYWQSKPSITILTDLLKQGKRLGAPRQDLAPLEAAVKAAQEVSDALMACLPQGATRQSHMRLNQRKVDSKFVQLSMTCEELIGLAISSLEYPVRLEKAAGMVLRLLGEVTRVRRAAWELLGVKTADDFAVLDSCFSRAEALMPSMLTKNPAISDLLARVTHGGARSGSSIVKGRWEGRRFSFTPSADLRRTVMRLEKELEILSVDAPEFDLLDKGYMERTEEGIDDDFEYDEKQMWAKTKSQKKIRYGVC